MINKEASSWGIWSLNLGWISTLWYIIGLNISQLNCVFCVTNEMQCPPSVDRVPSGSSSSEWYPFIILINDSDSESSDLSFMATLEKWQKKSIKHWSYIMCAI